MQEGHTWEDAIISATILPGYCFDTTLGESVWRSNTQILCDHRLSLLYQEKSELVTNTINQERYIIVESRDIIFAVTLGRRGMLCQTEIWQTKHSHIVICIEAESTA
ncbi:hypothetical protein JTB14_034364 [Gonioctena quinquepunctata]|nr:hypothetical protein JTB14_034364 [Gonioctena quinquepunctata]